MSRTARTLASAVLTLAAVSTVATGAFGANRAEPTAPPAPASARAPPPPTCWLGDLHLGRPPGRRGTRRGPPPSTIAQATARPWPRRSRSATSGRASRAPSRGTPVANISTPTALSSSP